MSIEKEQNLFMASISHELRTPLTSILGYGELLESTDLNIKQQEYLGNMLHSSKYLLSLVGDFLDIVKLKDNDISLDLKEIRLHTILTECANVIKTNIHHHVSLEVDIPFLEHTVLADDRRIKQVMLNLLSNAAKFTKSGTIKFYVKDIVYEEEQTKITVNIEDSGMGMSEEVQKALFDPFVTGDSTQGFGLGLFISQEIIKLMDGEIKVSSKEGQGSIFSVSFTLKKAQDKQFSKALLGKNILILSDENEYTQKLSTLIERFNAKLQYHSSSQNITSTLRNILSQATEYDIAIFDMTNMSCSVTDIIATLRMLHPTIKCIALLNDENSIKHSIFDKVITFPISASNLIFELEELSAIEQNKENKYIDFSHLKVLVVEDVEMSRYYIKEMLSVSFSISCDTASNGKEAVEKAELTSYDIILMDIRMPVMNGYEATKAIRKFNKNIPIVCMSADVYEKDIEAAKDSGMDSFIQKPLDKDELKQSLLNLITTGTIVQSDIQVKSNKKVEISKGYNSLKSKEKAYNHLCINFTHEIASSLLVTAKNSIEEYINNVKKNYTDKNAKDLVENFHAFKGLLGNLGLEEDAHMAGELQDIFKLGYSDDAYVLKEDFLKSMTNFLNALEE